MVLIATAIVYGESQFVNAGVVTGFFGACFMSAKHPYDVGDKVMIDNLNPKVFKFLYARGFCKNDGE
jgi:hypothetical protein